MLRNMAILIKNNSPIYVSKYVFHYVKGKFTTYKDYKVPQGLRGKELLQNCKDTFLMVKGGEIEKYLQKDKITAEAEQILQHQVDILGYQKVEIGNPCDWHKDFIRNVVWTEGADYRNNPMVIQGEGDPKVPQALSRSHHLVTLGQAYLLTGDNRYAEEYVGQISDWIAKNPVQKGINWQSTMDVAIRAVNWLIAAGLFLDCKTIGDSFWDTLIESLYQHMVFIRNHMEYRLINGNHFVTNVCGLVFLGLLFEKTPYGKRIFRFAFRTLVREMHNQVYKDGTNHEVAVYYHYYVTQLFLYTTIFLTKSGQRFPEWYLTRLLKMVEFIWAYTKPNGQAPHVGDADDGRFIKYLTNEPTDHRHLLALAAVFFYRPDFKEKAGKEIDDIVWMYGREGILKYDSLREANSGTVPAPEDLAVDGENVARVAPSSVREFPDSGYYIFADDEVYLFIKAGEIGLKGRGVHSHCDQLSFEMTVKGTDVFIDPGTYSYSGDHEMRNLFRSTSSHNTVVIDKLEQNRFDPQNIFAMDNDTKTEVVNSESADERYRLEAKHYGYWESLGILHNREFVLEKTQHTLAVIDTFDGAGEHLLEWFFHLSRDCEKLRLSENGATIVYQDGQVRMEFDGTLEYEIMDGYISKSYGQMVSAKVLRLWTRVDLEEKNQFQLLLHY